MKQFIDENFLLENDLAKALYNSNKDMPIFDYHCHLSAEDIFNNKKFDNITRLWIYDNGNGDHYKWRIMRASGIDEKYITGNATDYDKFLKFARIMPNLIGNPIYEWCHIELRKYFDIFDEINETNARKIYDLTEKKLNKLSARDFIKKSNVSYLFTTDDPLDTLIYHEKLENEKLSFEVYPCFRGDNLIKIDNPNFLSYIQKLSDITNNKISNINNLKISIKSRLSYFIRHKCLAADLGIDEYFPYEILSDSEINNILIKRLKGLELNIKEINAYKTYIIKFLMTEFANENIICELHIGPLRNVSKVNFNKLGRDSGFDMISDQCYISNLAKAFSDIEENGKLPKTIVFPINENDYDAVLSLLASFTSNKKGFMQLGAAWWFNDNYDGIIKNLAKQANYLPLGNMIGMLTDSRSFTSYIRHDYFRRIVCSFISKLVINGRYPNNMEQLDSIVKNIFYNNSKSFFLKDGQK